MAYSFYGGKQGPSYKIVAHYDSIYDMVIAFQEGGDYNTVGYGEYVIIDTICNNSQYSNPENGIIYRRGLNYIQNFDPNGKVLGTIDGIQLKTVAKEAVVDGNKIYYDITYDQDNNPIYTFNEQRFRETFATFVQNPGGGAQYVGQIVGPQGSSPQLNITTWEDLMEKMESSDAASLHKDSVQQIAHPAARFYKDYQQYQQYFPEEYDKNSVIENDIKDNEGNTVVKGIQDNINYAYLDILDAYGNIVGSYVAFDIPSPVFSYYAESIPPYEGWDSEDEKTHYATWNEENHRWEYANLISEDDISKNHPYYWQYNIKVPEGIHGQDIDSVGLNLPDSNYEKPLGEDVDSNETNHYYQFYYNLRNYNGEGKGQAQEDISLNYVPDGFLNSIYSIEDDIINPNLERRQPNQNYNIDDMVYAPGLPTEKMLDDEGILHILDLCLKATTSGQTGSKENLDVGMLAKLNSGSQFQDGDIIWEVVPTTARPLSLIQVYYTHKLNENDPNGGHTDIEIRSLEGIAQDPDDGTIYVKYSNINNLFSIGQIQSIESIEHVKTVTIPGETTPRVINRLCIHFNTYNRDVNGEIVKDNSFKIDPVTKEIIGFPTTDDNGKKIQYIDEQIKFIDRLDVDPNTQEIIVVYSDETTQSLGTHREIKKIELKNNNYLGDTQQFIAEYNTHLQNPNTDINDVDELSDSINTIVAIRQYGDNVIVLYSDPTFRKNLDSKVRVPLYYEYDENSRRFYISNCSYSLYDKNNILYNGDDPSITNVLYWYNIGTIYKSNHIYGNFDSLQQLKTEFPNGFVEEGEDLKDSAFAGWVATVIDSNVVTLYAYDYNAQDWYSLGSTNLSTVDPETALIVRYPQTNNTNLPEAPDNLNANGYWFVLSKRDELGASS